MRKIILVQACVRRWLARARYNREKSQFSSSAITLQRYVRGWLTRKQLALREQMELAVMRQKVQEEEKLRARNKKKKDDERDGKRKWFGGRLLKKFVQESNHNNNNNSANCAKDVLSEAKTSDKENEEPVERSRTCEKILRQYKKLSAEEAATVIQSYYRGYSVRRRWGEEFEARVSHVLSASSNSKSAQQGLEEEGLSPQEAASIVKRYFHNCRKNENPPAPKTRVSKANKCKVAASSHPVRIDEAELINFSQNVHLLNQEAHKHLRRNKSGIRLSEVESDYRNLNRPSERVASRTPELPNYIETVNDKVSSEFDYDNYNIYCDNTDEDCGDDDGNLDWDIAIRTPPRDLSGKRVKNSGHNRFKSQNEIAEREGFSPKGDSGISKPQNVSGRMSSRSRTPHSSKSPESQVDLRDLLRRKGGEELDICGPYNFRQLLRPAKHLPTESLRKRKGIVPSECHTQLIHLGDLPVKRKVQKY